MPTLPTTTLHSTSPESLLEDYVEALQAVRRADEALQRFAVPNARDYPGDDLERATTEHVARRTQLRTMHDDFEVVAMHLADIVCEREDRQRVRASVEAPVEAPVERVGL